MIIARAKYWPVVFYRCIVVIAICAAIVPGTNRDNNYSNASPVAAAAIATALTKMPLAFEPNRGQAAPDVTYITHLSGGVMSFSRTGVDMLLTASVHADPEHWSDPDPLATPQPPAQLHLAWQGANPAATLNVSDPLSGYVNYLPGNDPAAWHTDIPTFGQLRYEQLYPGIDLVYDGTSSALKGTYIVAAGADPTMIRWTYSGAANTSLDDAGNIEIHASGADSRGNDNTLVLREQAPIAWQQAAETRTTVDVEFVIEPDGSIGFKVGTYDHSQPLILDPYLLFSTAIGSGNSTGYGIAVDSAGAMYVAGTTASPNVPLVNPLQNEVRGNDAFIAKINPSGTAFVYSTYFGGSDEDRVRGMALDAQGQVYIAGLSYSADLSTTPDAFQPARNPSMDAFVSVLNAAGSGLVYSTYLGGNWDEQIRGIAVTPDGWATVAGIVFSSDFPLRNNYFPLNDGMAFISRFAPSGQLDYSTTIPGTHSAYGVALDAHGNAYVAGEIEYDGLPVFSAVQPQYGGGSLDGFVVSLAVDGSALRYSTYIGGNDMDFASSIAVTADGEAVVSGVTRSWPLLPPVGPLLQTPPLQPLWGGSNDAFVIRLSAAGSSMLYGTYLGGAGDDRAVGVALDQSGAAYITSGTNGGFPVVHAAQWTFGGILDAFMTKLDPSGSALEYSTYLGGGGTEYGWAVAAGANGNAYYSGYSDMESYTRPIGAVGYGGAAFVAAIGDECMLNFTDVAPGNNFYPYIENLACRGIISGYADGSYRVGAGLTRGQLTKIVSAAAGLQADIAPDAQHFADVAPSSPFWWGIEQVAAATIVSGYDCGTVAAEPCDGERRPYYRPNAGVTRGQAARLVARGAGWSAAISPYQQSFADVPADSTFWLDIERASAHGVVSGYDCGNTASEACDDERRAYYRPGGTITRGQAAKIVANSFFPNGENPDPGP